VDFNEIDELLIRYSAFIRYMKKNGSIIGQHISFFNRLQEGSVRIEVLCSILMNFTYL